MTEIRCHMRKLIYDTCCRVVVTADLHSTDENGNLVTSRVDATSRVAVPVVIQKT